jgi:hypothetical protein
VALIAACRLGGGLRHFFVHCRLEGTLQVTDELTFAIKWAASGLAVYAILVSLAWKASKLLAYWTE